MPIIPHNPRFVIGVDTHARTHALAVVAAAGPLIAEAEFPTSPAGLTRAVAWAGRRTGGDLDALWAIEGVGSYGAGLARAARQHGYQVVEAPRYRDRRRDRARGKSDPLDARRIARAAIASDQTETRHPRRDDGPGAALRVLLTAREQMTKARTAAINALTAVLRTRDLGIDARRRPGAETVSKIARWRPRGEPVAPAAARAEAVRLARQIEALDGQLRASHERIRAMVKASPAAGLLDITGVGPITAAVALTAWSHPGRVRSEAAFAALAGVNPIPASSGNTVRHRLNRGGDRRLNHALHMAAVTRMTYHDQTRQYVARRTAEGKTSKEIRRCIKRYLARQIYRHLESAADV